MAAPDSPTISWVAQAVTAGASFTLGLISAVVAEPLRQRLFRPKLRVEFTGLADCIAPTELTDKSRRVYVRLKVVNEKHRIAKSCRAFLVRIECRHEDGTFQPTIYADTLQLAWSCRVHDSYDGIDLVHGVSQYVDVVATAENGNTFGFMVKPWPLRYNELIAREPRLYRLVVQVSGDGVDPATTTLDFAWKGNWEKVDAYGVGAA